MNWTTDIARTTKRKEKDEKMNAKVEPSSNISKLDEVHLCWLSSNSAECRTLSLTKGTRFEVETS